jgi:hypothetical protein
MQVHFYTIIIQTLIFLIYIKIKIQIFSGAVQILTEIKIKSCKLSINILMAYNKK